MAGWQDGRMTGWQDMNGSMVQTLTSGIAHNIWFAEEKVDILKSERSMEEDLSLLSIRSIGQHGEHSYSLPFRLEKSE
jgi:hypothetical protein